MVASSLLSNRRRFLSDSISQSSIVDPMNALNGGHASGENRPKATSVALWVSRVAVLLFAVLSPYFARADAVPQQKLPVQDVTFPGFELTIGRDGVHGNTEVDVGADEKFKPFFRTPDHKIKWNPREFLAETKLVCRLTGKELLIGQEESVDVCVEATTEYIRADRSGKLRLRIPRPESLAPGVYQGRLKTEFVGIPVEAINAVIRGNWPITIVVPGRILQQEHVQFEHAQNGNLHVGQPATVTAVIDTIGCDLGTGDLTVRFTPLAGDPRPLLSLPMPIDGFLDPLIDLQNREKVCPEWQDVVLHSNVETVEVGEDLSATHSRYRIVFHVGDCFAPGERIEAEVTWPQASEAPVTADKKLRAKSTANVVGGILISPRIAFDTETVYIKVVSPNDLGTKCDLTLIAPDESPWLIQLSHARLSWEQSGSKGVAYRYTYEFQPHQLGTWRVTWPEADAQAVGETAQPAQFNVWGRLVNRLEQPHEQGVPVETIPLRVFASETPLGWNLIYTPDEGRGYHQYRFGAFELGFDSRYAGNVRFRPQSIYCVSPESPDSVSAWDPERQPYLHIAPGDPKRRRTTRESSSAPEGSFGTVEARPDDYAVAEPDKQRAPDVALPEEGLLPFDVFCAVTPVLEEHPRKDVAVHNFIYRGLITGNDGEGRPIARILELPFTVDVTNHWQYYREWTIWAVVIVAVVVFLGYAWYRANHDPSSKSLPSGSTAATAIAEVSEFMGDSPTGSDSDASSESGTRPSSQSSQTSDEHDTRPPTPKPKPPAPPGPPTDDDGLLAEFGR